MLCGGNLCLDTEEKLLDYLARLKAKRDRSHVREEPGLSGVQQGCLYHAKQIIAGLYQHDEEEKGGDKVWTAEKNYSF